MSNDNPSLPFEIFTTKDGSPTLSIEGGEKMHSLEGALAESLYIYAPCVREAINSSSPRLLSMGLGLGYNELIALGFLKQKNTPDFHISSFESLTFLRTALENWLLEKDSPLKGCYQEILGKIAQELDMDTKELFQFSQTCFKEKKWTIQAALPHHNSSGLLFNGILYDAFSSETDEYLWTEEHLENFLDEYADTTECFFSTYAATGRLKRSLQKKGFLLEKKAGFGMKRESTFAKRCQALNPYPPRQ